MKAKFCEKCGVPFSDEEQLFCEKCGTKREMGEEETASKSIARMTSTPIEKTTQTTPVTVAESQRVLGLLALGEMTNDAKEMQDILYQLYDYEKNEAYRERIFALKKKQKALYQTRSLKRRKRRKILAVTLSAFTVVAAVIGFFVYQKVQENHLAQRVTAIQKENAKDFNLLPIEVQTDIKKMCEDFNANEMDYHFSIHPAFEKYYEEGSKLRKTDKKGVVQINYSFRSPKDSEDLLPKDSRQSEKIALVRE